MASDSTALYRKATGKEARKKELKKNKKQRQMVRAAVLKGKDPIQLISEMEKIDQMEYNVLQPPPLNEKVLKDKRKKLKETLERVMSMYDKDDPDKWSELKRMEVEYEKRRQILVTYAESVRHAQSVQVDDIPLPSLQFPTDAMGFIGIPSQIPLPADLPIQLIPHPLLPPLGMPLPPPPGILKKISAYSAPAKLKKPPGVPPGPPPDISDDEESMEQDEESYENSSESKAPARQRTIRFADDEMADGGVIGKDSELAATPASVAAEPETPVANEDPMSSNQPDSPPVLASKPTSLQQKMLAMAGQDIEQFMREFLRCICDWRLESTSIVSTFRLRPHYFKSSVDADTLPSNHVF
uniref:(California timema) hypothetical protein n=1 Tax=Timema californicum TaxID=61474 RepID=A0A7R9JE94_TIMCA|nr:unnamed protein product [Timema californicum]